MTNALEVFRDGKPQKAEEMLRTIAMAAPHDADVRVALGIVACSTGDKATGIERMLEALDLQPGHRTALEWLAALYLATGSLEEAQEACNRGLATFPDDAHFLKLRGQCSAERGDATDALKYFDQATLCAPTDPEAHYARGTVLRRLGRDAEALVALERSRRLAPVHSVQLEIAEVLINIGRTRDAVANCALALEGDPNSYRVQLAAARALTESGSPDQARPHWDKAEALEPRPGEARLEKAFSLAWIGRFDEARTEVLRAIDVDPTRGRPYYVLAASSIVGPNDGPLLEAIEDMLADPRTGAVDRVDMHYALGKSYEDLGEFASAMSHFNAANALKRDLQFGNRPFDREGFRRFVDTQIESFPKVGGLAETGEPELPIFVSGMMRSGTTLVDQILSCHADVGSAGEQGYWMDHEATIAACHAPTKADESIGRLRQNYIELLSAVAPGAPHVIDKNPANIMIAGLLHKLFPNSRTICTRRSAIDTALSIWTTNVTTSAPFVYERSSIVFAYKEVLRLMEHWQSTLPSNRYSEIRYEDIVERPRETVGRLLGFCGLKWDEACLHPETNSRAVKTPSFWQVRKPLYRTSVERWKRYRDHLDVFQDLIGL
jgi:tetratricopeptide (TPR) repeat protein